jgi:hypothetical protein
MPSRPIHDAIEALLREMGLCAAPAPLLRTILVHDGYFVGEKYRFDGGCATWMAKTNVIEVCDDEGKLLKTVALGKPGKGEAA